MWRNAYNITTYKIHGGRFYISYVFIYLIRAHAALNGTLHSLLKSNQYHGVGSLAQLRIELQCAITRYIISRSLRPHTDFIYLHNCFFV